MQLNILGLPLITEQSAFRDKFHLTPSKTNLDFRRKLVALDDAVMNGEGRVGLATTSKKLLGMWYIPSKVFDIICQRTQAQRYPSA